MAHSYTPGLLVAEQTKIVKERQLPTEPDKTAVLVKVGEKVEGVSPFQPPEASM